MLGALIFTKLLKINKTNNIQCVMFFYSYTYNSEEHQHNI